MELWGRKRRTIFLLKMKFSLRNKLITYRLQQNGRRRQENNRAIRQKWNSGQIVSYIVCLILNMTKGKSTLCLNFNRHISKMWSISRQYCISLLIALSIAEESHSKLTFCKFNASTQLMTSNTPRASASIMLVIIPKNHAQRER